MLRGRKAVAFGAVLAALLAACAVDADVAEIPSPTTAVTQAPAEPTNAPTPGPTETVAAPAAASVVSANTVTGERGEVVAVVDGDTIDVMLGGVEQRIRLLLIDTPEVHGGTDCYGPEASARAKALLPVGTPVELVRDVSETDRYGRLLRYVYLPDGQMLNEVLVAEGYAQLATYPPDIAEVDRIRAAQTAAREAGRGLWTACATVAPATPTPMPTPVTPAPTTAPPPPVATAQANCDASYPDVCIPPYPPDLDCGEIPFRRFRVVGADPHGFDRDRDGIGCES